MFPETRVTFDREPRLLHNRTVASTTSNTDWIFICVCVCVFQSALVKLSDFGFAKVDEGNLTTPHYTPYYVAPQVDRALATLAINKDM